ncbi:hypothetical protein XA68_15755 [Ophiocordyceps unilateralis]|uniref:C2H2-type domain-containing protein n=1 Tax=Ophiocordyceps unilateralis TaxID=268505 RepID=A0A2A9P662_OPHUN|nr:hypothetical protein XA68_15755 [Ophiocordyceps unilateralis]
MKRQREPADTRLETLTEDGQSDVMEQPAKISELDYSPDEVVIMKCSLPPHKHPITFNSYNDYEAHYHTFHTHRCLECHKNLPSDHLLSIHIEECHDPLICIQRERGEHTYSCFVEGCDRKCRTHQKRRMHLIDKHMYPKNYYFAVTKEGIDHRRSLLVDAHHQHRSAPAAPGKSPIAANIPEESRVPDAALPSKQEVQPADLPTAPDVDMDQLSGAMSSLQFVPPHVRFGRGRAGFSRK